MIGFVFFGLVVGALARLVLPGRQHLGLVATLLIGLAGSVAGGTIASLLGTGDVFELDLLGTIVAVISAAILILLVDRATAGKRVQGSA
ncbi:MAG: GlsB/YeaQ/YmgE family stress response membrane protein [Acidimicrobiales bacterium]